MGNNTALAYQGAAAEGATHIGLLVMVYNAVAGDLLRAAEAVRKNDIELRSSSAAHALLLLGHVESWLDSIEDANLVASLRVFYGTLRARIIQLQAAPEPGQLEELATLISETGATWQIKERSLSTPGQAPSSASMQNQENAQTHMGGRKLRLDA